MQLGFTDVLITVLFLLALGIPGFILAKIKALPEKSENVISVLVLYACQPALVFMAFQKTVFSPDLALNMLLVAGLAVVVHAVMIAFVYLVFRNKNKEAKINCMRFASVFSNCGYMGLPFLQSLFAGGSAQVQGEILIYAGVVIAVFNLFNWSIGVYMISGDKKQMSVKNALLNPTVIGLFLGLIVFFTVRTPFVNLASPESVGGKIIVQAVKSINFLAEAVTPLAMTVIGIKLANSSFKKVFLDKWAYVTAFNKLVVMALVAMLCVAFLPLPVTVKYAVFFTLAMPSATGTVMFAVRFGGDAESGSAFVLLSTLLSVISVPLMFLLMNNVLGVTI